MDTHTKGDRLTAAQWRLLRSIQRAEQHGANPSTIESLTSRGYLDIDGAVTDRALECLRRAGDL